MKSMPFLEEFEEASKSERVMIFYGAPLLIFISVKMSHNPLWRVVNFLDCGLAAQNMFLFAFQEGLGSCFIGFADHLNHVPEYLEQIGIPEDHELMARLIFGYSSYHNRMSSPDRQQTHSPSSGWHSSQFRFSIALQP